MVRPLRTWPALLLVQAIAAQATWVADVHGGAGSHFRSIRAALDVAAAGDTILVRPGDHREHTLTATRGVRVVAERGARVWNGTTTTSFRVAGIPPSSAVRCPRASPGFAVAR